MIKIDSRSAQVHFLFEGLLAGQINSLSPEQREIIVFAMSKAFSGLKNRQKAHAKIQHKQERQQLSFNQEGRRGRQAQTEDVTVVHSKAWYWVTQAFYVLLLGVAAVITAALIKSFQ